MLESSTTAPAPAPAPAPAAHSNQTVKQKKKQTLEKNLALASASLLTNSCSTEGSGMYRIVDGVRHVRPYIYEFATFAKGRWLGRSLLDVVGSEFGGLGYDTQFWTAAIRNGHIKINGKRVEPAYAVQNSDYLTRRTHRHEPPVFGVGEGGVRVIGQTDAVMAVLKPASLPMHACGAYHYNSLSTILRTEGETRGMPLHIVHRLDRVTSGVVVLGRTKEAAKELSDQIQSRDTKKTYLARVKGRFPARLSHLPQLPLSVPGAAPAPLVEQLCELVGLDNEHQQRVKAYKNTSANKLAKQANQRRQREEKAARLKERQRDGRGQSKKRRLGEDGATAAAGGAEAEDAEAAAMPEPEPELVPAPMPEDDADKPREPPPPIPLGLRVFRSRCSVSGEDDEAQLGKYADTIHRCFDQCNSAGAGAGGGGEVQSVLLQCPLVTVCFKDGVYACDQQAIDAAVGGAGTAANPTAASTAPPAPEQGPSSDASGDGGDGGDGDPTSKHAVSLFTFLQYDVATDTSLVLCHPVTGRTHQLRLHLQLLGCPIANDVCYGGALFYCEPPVKRRAALAAYRSYGREGFGPTFPMEHVQALLRDELLQEEEEEEERERARKGEGTVEQEGASSSSSSVAAAPAGEAGAGAGAGGGSYNKQVLNGFLDYIGYGKAEEGGGAAAAARTKDQSSTSSSSSAPAAAPEASVDDTGSSSATASTNNCSLLPGETEDAHIMRTCRYCQEEAALALHQYMHCDGIFLHALRYESGGSGEPGAAAQAGAAVGSEGGDVDKDKAASTPSIGAWCFEAPWPEWAEPFKRP